MTAQTVTAAVARRDEQNQALARMRGWQADIAMAAATHVKPSAVIRVTQGALRRNPKLMDAAMANPQSLLYALLDCARLGHEPDTDDYYLVPFGNEVTGIEGYKGIIERMYRAGAVSAVVAEVVRQRDVYRRQGATIPPVHEFDEFADPEDRGPLRGAYAYAVMPGGLFSKVITMGRAEIMRHRAKSRGSDKSDSPWQQWEESMWKKTVLRGLEPYVPTSAEYRDGARPAAQLVPLPSHPGAPAASEPVFEAEVVEEPPPQDPAPAERPPAKTAQDKLQRLTAQVFAGWQDHDVAAVIASATGHPLEETLTAADAKVLITTLEDALREAGGDAEKAASDIWQHHQEKRDG